MEERVRRKRDAAQFEPTTDVGRRIDALREELGLTINELARRAGADSGNVSRLRLGERHADRIGIRQAFAIADALGVEARWLFLGEGPKTALNGARIVEAQKLVREAARLLGE